jgi:DNA-binding protein HU-beta
MTKQEVVAELMKRTGIKRKQAIAAFETFLKSIKDALTRKEKVSLVGFGTFLTKKKNARRGRNPRTGQEIRIPEKTVVVFKPGKEFRQLVKKS